MALAENTNNGFLRRCFDKSDKRYDKGLKYLLETRYNAKSGYLNTRQRLLFLRKIKSLLHWLCNVIAVLIAK
jgi:hypothetical protein